MNFILKFAEFALSFFPDNVKIIIRKIMPLKYKRLLGRKIMLKVAEDGGHIDVNDGRKFLVIKDRLFLRVFFEKDYEPLLSLVASKLLDKNDIAVDVGANFGWYTTLFAKYLVVGKVISYEPMIHSYNVLCENIKINHMMDRVFLKNLCVGENHGGSLLLKQDSISESGLAHVVENSDATTIKRKVVNLDSDLKKSAGKISFIKIDIEGYELSALKGAKSLLEQSNQPILQIEVNNDALKRSGSSRKEVLEFLNSLGYVFYEVDKRKPGYLIKSDARKCSDLFCFGKGEYAERISNVI